MRYDREYSRDYRAFEAGLATGYPAWHPGPWMGVPFPGFGWGGFPWPAHAPLRHGAYNAEYLPRRRPEESPTYGRGGDEEVLRWARRYGYDAGYAIPLRNGRGRGWRGHGRYDEGYRRGPGR